MRSADTFNNNNKNNNNNNNNNSDNNKLFIHTYRNISIVQLLCNIISITRTKTIIYIKFKYIVFVLVNLSSI